MIWLSCQVNPNGVTGKDDIRVTYTLHYENRKTGIKFYSYDTTWYNLKKKFDQWLQENYLKDIYENHQFTDSGSCFIFLQSV